MHIETAEPWASATARVSAVSFCSAPTLNSDSLALSQLSSVVVDAADGPLAADVCLRRRPYAVVVVDYHLGRERSGAEYAARIDRGARPLIVTGRADVGELRRIAARVDVPVYTRPVDARDWDALAEVVGGMVDDATG
jgi:hypothetical protein